MTLRVNRPRSNQNDYLNILRQANMLTGSLTDTAIILSTQCLLMTFQVSMKAWYLSR